MRSRPLRLVPLGLLLVLVAAACSPAATPAPSPTLPPPPPPPTPTIAAVPVLALTGTTGTTELTMEALQRLPAIEGYGGIKSSTGEITLPAVYRGVALADLAQAVGAVEPGTGLSLTAKDGYSLTFSGDQIQQGAFIAYDPATGDEMKSPPPLTALLAFERDGQPMSDEEGPLRVAIVSPAGNQVTDGHWSVKWVTAVERKELVEDWQLSLVGALSDSIDRASFESCSAPQCHGSSWTDDKGQVWSGVPFWLLAGSVDDAIQHEGPAFNEAVASAGYTITVTAADGYSAEFDSASVARNPDLLVANLVDGQPLPEKYFPLRLVSSTLPKNQLVGMISEIALSLEPMPTAAPTAEAASASGAGFVVQGLVGSELSLADSDLRALGVVKKTLGHPKKGATEYEGVPVLALLEAAGIKPEAKTLVLTAGDGYSAEVPLADVLSCADCLLAFTDTPGEYALAMPGLASNAWVKGIVRIEAK